MHWITVTSWRADFSRLWKMSSFYRHHLSCPSVKYYCCIHVGFMHFVLGLFLEMIIFALVNR